ncbi:amino acid adenylation domain-containing protein [Streptomyces sudanensis]|uniref:amino acid adenylation domain-containing protein n=1 Tax=Streptomyces sudanensis TaxID=436397 RepID=UPI0020CD075C|nr:amino acid adenylation domain-containing protein [Streptomyces sudanensis]MCP9956920.1 amino acid adenylation domain-containing protein [Streptomyces sudanensis]MCQ0002496.1 amino acid adenylation domain-containing protein [Streptomyces sudanensis]
MTKSSVPTASPTSLPPWSIDPADQAGPAPALGDLVRAAAGNWPDRPALHDGRGGLTFAELEQQARAFAAWLAEQGVGPGDRVAILAEKCAIMPVLAIGIWKCGAVYVPLDAAQPVTRLRSLLGRLRPRAVIALDDREPAVDDVHWVGRTRLDAILAGPAPDRPTVAHRPEDTAYIIFTSGSTGEPKGVEITVANLVAYFGNHNEVLRFTPDSRVFSLSPFHFDVSIEDTLLPLSLGAFVYQFRGVHAGAVMRAVIMRERITHLIAVSTLLTMITEGGRQVTRENFPALEMVMTGAEVCDPGVINVWKNGLPEVRVINVYGPTEATIVCVAHEIERVDPERTASYPIGRPLRGVVARIVEDDGTEIHEHDRIGELWIGGEQVMRGYFDQPEETARRVVEVDGVRYYRTGDMCSYDEDGDIVFRGRNDDEVKLAGRRIHLGEIRQTALSCPGVERVAVALVPRHGHDVIALVVMAPDRAVVGDVEKRLADLLPAYMRPALVAWSPELTVSSTGKTDEKALMRRLAEAAGETGATHFAFTAAGDVEPVDGDGHA